MLTPARTKDSSKRVSRLGSSTFSNPFKRRGSNAAVFTTPSSSDFSFQQLEDIGFADPQLVIDTPFASNSPSVAWPPRKPLPRSSTMNPPRPESRLPDSPTLRGPRLSPSRTTSTAVASRIPAPDVRTNNRASPIKLRPTTFENVKASSTVGMKVDAPQRSARAELNRLSSYEVVHHQLLKPKLPRLDSSSNLFAIPGPDLKQTTSPTHSSPTKLASSRCVSGSPPKRLKLETSSSQKQVPTLYQHQNSPHRSQAPMLPPIVSSPNFDPTMTIKRTPDLLDGEVVVQRPETIQEEMDLGQTLEAEASTNDQQDVDIERFFEPISPARLLLSRHISKEERDKRIDDEFPVNHIYEAQSTAYWTGRFMSLHDCLMNEAHALPDPRDVDGEDKMHQIEVARTKQIFFNLQDCCQTPSAEASMKQFKRMYALKKHMPFLLEAKPNSGIATLLRRSNKHEEKSNDWAGLSSASTISVAVDDDMAGRPKLPRMTSNDSAVSSSEGKKSRFVDKFWKMNG